MSVSIVELVTDLSTRPRPVICLDTCDLLDVIRGPSDADLSHFRSFVRIDDALELDSKSCQMVITFLVQREWERNIGNVCDEVSGKLRLLSRQLESIEKVSAYAKLIPIKVPDIPGPTLVDRLVALTHRVLAMAAVLKQDATCIERAVDRVANQKRPSHKNHVKDSIHLEHYLELARQLKAAGYGEPCVFVSSNKADFWAATGEPRVHPDLERDLTDAGLAFFPRLENAVRSLGI